LKILVYCRNSVANKQALEIALEQAQAFGASVDLVSCLSEKDRVPLEVFEEIDAKLQNYMKEIFSPASVPCITQVLKTSHTEGEEVVRYAEDNAIDTIIMSLKKRSQLGKMFFGSNAQFILLEAPCKVISTT